MLKWLSGARPKGPQPAEVVTDDPLATIHVAAAGKLDGPLEIYAVSRVNPIFDEGGGPADRRGGGRLDRGGSSGYGSSGSGSGGGSGGGSGARSPCNSSSGGESPKQSAPPTPEQAPPARTSAATPSGRCAALQSRSPLPPRQPRPPPASPPPPPPEARPPPPDTPPPPPPGGGAPSSSSTSSSSRLCPIPEGRPVAVPRPIWPPAHLEALYAALAKHSAHAHVPASAAASTARDHASDTASSSASSGFGDEHPPSLSTRLVRGERCSSTSVSSSREKLLTARSDAGAGVGVGSVCRAHAPPVAKSPSVATAAAATAVAATGHWTGVTPGDVCLQSKDGLLWKPDFTLDKAAAERLMRNIQKAKRRRCVCHAATSFLGLAVFLLSVMLVSLAMTGGRRYFGSL